MTADDLCSAILSLYPRAWRARYEYEVRALLEDDRPTLWTVLDLLRGALDAHLHPEGLIPPARERMRGTVIATVCCWIAFVIVGAGFAKSTEDVPFRAAGTAHALLGTTRLAVAVLAVLCTASLALGCVPLVAVVVWQAWRERRRELVRALLVPALALGAFAGATGLMALGIRAGHGPVLQVAFGLWLVLGFATAVVCALSVRAALRAARLRASELSAGVLGSWFAARAMAAVAVGVAVYAGALAADAPAVAATPNGALHITTTVWLAGQAVAMAAIATIAQITTARGRAALRWI